MMACPIGIDWSVTHLQGQIRIDNVVRFDTTTEEDGIRFDGLSVDIAEGDYCREIVAFARKAKELFEGITKIFYDDFDQQEYKRFWAEYNLLLELNSRSI